MSPKRALLALQNEYIAPVIAPNVEALDNDFSLPEQNHPIYFVYDVDHEVDIDTAFTAEELAHVEAAIIAGQNEAAELSFMAETRMTHHEFNKLILSLNTQQKQAFDFIKNHFEQNTKSPFHLCILGPGGTGKSHVISAIQELIRREKLENAILYLFFSCL